MLPDSLLARDSRAAWTAAGLLAAAVLGCTQPPTGPAVGDREVIVATPLVEKVIDYLEFTGYTEPEQAVDVRARVSGYLQKIEFKEGKEVTGSTDPKTPGDLLCQIDDRPFVVVRDRLSASLDGTKVQLARALADAERYKTLPPGTVTKEQLEKVAAEAATLTNSVKSQEAALREAQLQVDFARVTAPISGRTDRALVTEGNLVQADQTILTTITKLDPMYVYFDVDEATLIYYRDEIRTGRLKATAEGDFEIRMALQNVKDGFPNKGYLNFVASRVNPTTGSLQLRARFDNPADKDDPTRPRALAPGMFCRIQAKSREEHPALLVTEKAVVTDLGQKFLYVIGADGRVEARKVTLGGVHDGLREVLPSEKEGESIKEGDKIIVSGVQRVRPGEKVPAKEISMADYKLSNRAKQIEKPVDGDKDKEKKAGHG
jgi:RND family efflux transporter MFP subunit